VALMIPNAVVGGTAGGVSLFLHDNMPVITVNKIRINDLVFM